jgi:hypothetical protein
MTDHISLLERARAKLDGESRADAAWPDLEPLPEGLPTVPSFDPLVLPGSFRPWIEDIADRMQCPPDFPAVGATVALAAVSSRLPRRRGDGGACWCGGSPNRYQAEALR